MRNGSRRGLSRHSYPGTLLCWLAFALPGAVRADFVVLQSDAAEFAVGRMLAGDTGVTLAEGESMVLLSDDGDVIEVNGPYDGLPQGIAAENLDIRNALAHLIDNADRMHTTLGSTRGSVTGRAPPPARDAWHLDPFYTGNQCVVDGAEVRFWRSDAAESLTLLMQRPGKAGDGNVSWAEGEQTAAWPPNLPLADDELYVLRRPGWMENAMIRIVVLEPGIEASGTAAVAWLAVNGCREQAAILFAALP